MGYFDNCHTPEELKKTYHKLALKMHPDMGGKSSDFRKMKDEYDLREQQIKNNEHRVTMPLIFNMNESYEYFRRPVKYAGISYNHYYKFVQDFGADILIEEERTNLIFTKIKYI